MSLRFDEALVKRFQMMAANLGTYFANLGNNGKVLPAQLPDTDGITEGSVNLYLTAARVGQAFGAAGNLSYNPVTGLFSVTVPVASVNSKTGAIVLDKTDIGLGNVNNTADADKPISTAMQAALNLKSGSAHTHSKADLGLGNIDNTADANKPVSVAQQAAMNAAIAATKAQPVYTVATLRNSWASTGVTNADPRYFIDTLGFIHIFGSCRAGTTGVMFTLPAGMRPSTALYCLGVDGLLNVPCIVRVLSNGDVSSPVVGPTAICHFTIPPFKAEA